MKAIVNLMFKRFFLKKIWHFPSKPASSLRVQADNRTDDERHLYSGVTLSPIWNINRECKRLFINNSQSGHLKWEILWSVLQWIIPLLHPEWHVCDYSSTKNKDIGFAERWREKKKKKKSGRSNESFFYSALNKWLSTCLAHRENNKPTGQSRGS